MRTLTFRIVTLLALGVVDYTLHRPWRIFALVAIMLYVIEWTAFRHRRDIIFIARQRRHRLANQLQLVAGWLQLGATDKAEQALETLLASENHQSTWFRGLPSYWGYLFLQWDARGEAQGVLIGWQGIESLVPTYRMSWMLSYRLSQAIRIAEKRISVEFLGDDFRIYVPFGGGNRPWGWVRTVDGLEVHRRSKRATLKNGSSLSR